MPAEVLRPVAGSGLTPAKPTLVSIEVFNRVQAGCVVGEFA